MSPGFTAAPEGMFSQAATTPTTLTFSFNSASARIVPMTLAAPHMSNFISSIAAPGLMEMPPESNVMPLPTSTTGAPLAEPLYFSTINRGGCADPLATDKNEPIFSASSCFVSSTSISSFQSFANLRASSARKLGVQMLGGRFPSRFANSMPFEIAPPYRSPRSAAALRAFNSKPTVWAPLVSGSRLLFSSSVRNEVSRAAIATLHACHSLSRPLTCQSSAATVTFFAAPLNALTLLRTASVKWRSLKSCLSPSPASRTRGALTPASPSSGSSVPRLPVMSPLFTAPLITPPLALSSVFAVGVSSPSA